jgi:hypothetical protein
MQTYQKPGGEVSAIFLTIALFFGMMSCAYAANATASPILRCEVSYAGTTHTIDTSFIQDPYLAPMHDIGGRFSFKAVMMGTNKKIDYIKLYAYLQGRELDIPIHQATYRKPIHTNKTMKVLTPINHLYAGEVEREMQYQCFLGGNQK